MVGDPRDREGAADEAGSQRGEGGDSWMSRRRCHGSSNGPRGAPPGVVEPVAVRSTTWQASPSRAGERVTKDTEHMGGKAYKGRQEAEEARGLAAAARRRELHPGRFGLPWEPWSDGSRLDCPMPGLEASARSSAHA